MNSYYNFYLFKNYMYPNFNIRFDIDFTNSANLNFFSNITISEGTIHAIINANVFTVDANELAYIESLYSSFENKEYFRVLLDELIETYNWTLYPEFSNNHNLNDLFSEVESRDGKLSFSYLSKVLEDNFPKLEFRCDFSHIPRHKNILGQTCELGKSILRNNHDERLCITGEIFVSSYEQFNTIEVMQLSKDLAGFLQKTHQSVVWPFEFHNIYCHFNFGFTESTLSGRLGYISITGGNIRVKII